MKAFLDGKGYRPWNHGLHSHMDKSFPSPAEEMGRTTLARGRRAPGTGQGQAGSRPLFLGSEYIAFASGACRKIIQDEFGRILAISRHCVTSQRTSLAEA